VTGKARTLFVGLDSCDPELARGFAAEGDMPNLARLLTTGARARFANEPGYFVGSVWPTLMTGAGVDRHHWFTGTRFRPEHYDYVAHPLTEKTVWERCHEAGLKVAVFDAPHVKAIEGLNGVQVCEWGCHDRQYGTHSWPPSLVAELEARHGTHPIGTMSPHDDPRHSPCDYVHRQGETRSDEETVALFSDLLEGIVRKTAASLDLLDRGGWDLFYCVFGESHCAGHQLWHLHDVMHEQHNRGLLARMGIDDPLREVYRQLDVALGEHLKRLDDESTALVTLSHGIRAHYDSTHLLPAILSRLDDAYADSPSENLGPLTAAVDRALDLIPKPARATAIRLAGPLIRARFKRLRARPLEADKPLSARTFIPIDNNSVWGAVRLNQVGREAAGQVAAGDRDDALSWLEHRLRELVNVETGGPVVLDAVRSDSLYRHQPDDPLADLLLEWNSRHPVRKVWSPAVGLLEDPYLGVRTGDHSMRGLLLGTGPGFGRGETTAGPVDVVPTIVASLGLAAPDLEGSPPPGFGRADSSGSRSIGDAGLEVLRQRLERRRRERRAARRADNGTKALVGLEGLLAAHHETRQLADAAAADVARLQETAAQEASAAEVLATMAWIRNCEIADGPVVSVIIPTRNRRDQVLQAIESVRRQSYAAVEIVVVDDASDDRTWKHVMALDDPRIRCVRLAEPLGCNRARNRGLDDATGGVIAYLDDDNTFDRDWVKSVVWALSEHPEIDVVYGARVVDDVDRHHGRPPGGLPWLQLLPWDREAARWLNRVDMNVLAHRRSPVRFDESIAQFGDWDLVLQLTEAKDPLRLPVIASYYTTDGVDRMSNADPDFIDRQVELVRTKWASR
jgi:predicted AlkP superfamily phosphohydrolase/phosphomutase